jgi:hypothetical protein
MTPIDDVYVSGQDFLSTFPVIRHIERQHLTLSCIGCRKTPSVISNIHKQAEAVHHAAAVSDIVAVGAVEAL